MWLPLAWASAILLSFRRVGEKELSSKLNHFTIGWLVQLLSLPVMLIIWLVAGKMFNPFSLSAHFWIPLLIIWLVIYPLNTLGYFKAVKGGHLSNVLPVHSLIPVMSLLLAWLIIGEKPSMLGVFGVLAIVLGVYTLNITGAKLHNPIKPFLEDKATLYMLLSAVSIAVGSVLDKVAIKASESLYYNVVNTIGAVFVLFIIAKLLKSDNNAGIKSNFPKLAGVGTLQGFAYTAYIVALSVGPVAYVVSIRSANVLIGSLIGIWFLKEAFTKTKFVAFGLILFGFVLL